MGEPAIQEKETKWIKLQFNEIGESIIVEIPFTDEDANFEYTYNKKTYLFYFNPKRDIFGESHFHPETDKYPPEKITWIEVLTEANTDTLDDGSNLEIIITLKGEENFDIVREDL